jgi:hypothetical protein
MSIRHWAADGINQFANPAPKPGNMKHQEFYRKCKARYPPMISPWILLAIMVVASLTVPLFVYRNVRTAPLTLSGYLEQIEYFLFVGVPLGLLLIWANWREAVKRRKGYCWVGKFEVIGKSKSFLTCHLNLFPGEGNRLRVDRGLYHETHIGDCIIIRRDALGGIGEVRRVKDVLNRLSKAQA